MDFQQSQTYNNILKSYDIELMANTRYELYADRARQEGYIEIATINETTARNHREHARIWLRQMNNGILPTTEQNILSSMQFEAELGNVLYRDYARIAREEGYDSIASLFNGIANIELNHDLRFRNLYEDLIRDQVFCKPTPVLWICMQCGNIMNGLCAPEICPICNFPQGYYRVYVSELDG